MPARLYLTANIESALENARSHLTAVRDSPLAPAYLLLPSTVAIQSTRAYLEDSAGVRLQQFYALGQQILDDAGSPIRCIDNLAVRRLVRQILSQMQASGELTTFAGVAEKSGFTQALMTWLREMKSQGIPPEAVQAQAGISNRKRDRQLASFYRRYQNFLTERGYSDNDGLLWLAAEALENDPHLCDQMQPFCVLGFDQFNPMQRRILGELAKRLSDMTVYLLWDADRAQDSLALTRLHQTREALRRDLALNEVVLPDEGTAAPAMVHLRRTLFEADAGVLDVRPPAGESPAVQAVAAPSREAEVRWALRAVKRLLVEGKGILPDQIALLAPQSGTYRRLVETVASEYGLPLKMAQSLDHNPAVAALMKVLSLYPEFLWRPTFDVLRSPYVQQSWLSQEQIEKLEELTRERPVVAGPEQWLFALQPLEVDVPDLDDEDRSHLPLVAQLSREELSAIETGLMAFFDHLTPGETASHRQYARWLQERLLGLTLEIETEDGEELPEQTSLHMVACCQTGDQGRRDMLAMAQVTHSLRRLVESADLISEGRDLDHASPLPWMAFRSELLEALTGRPVRIDHTGSAVIFGSLEDGRATVIDFLFVLGLAEGEFPQLPVADPIYAPSERKAQQLPLQLINPAEDASLWWQVLANCRRSLTLLRPRLDENGAPWLPSPYWGAVMDRVQGVGEVKPPVAGLPGVLEAASGAELLAALARAGAGQVPEKLDRVWQAAQEASAVIEQRQSWQPPGNHEGIISAPDVLAELAKAYGWRHSWSPSRLNRYGNCPYGFFAQEILKLQARQDPEEGLDPLQRGSLLHAILELLYRRLAEEDLAPSIPNQAKVLDHLDASCDALFPGAPQRYGFRPGPLWRYEQQELRRMLRALLTWEIEQNGAAARFLPYRQEQRFGIGEGGLPHLSLVGEAGTEFHLRGVIDRLDLDESGQAWVIDYKSGSGGYSKQDVRQGLALQTALYALAAEKLLADVDRVAESAYLHIPTRKFSGRLKPAEKAGEDPIVQAAVDRAEQFVERVRQGIFPSAPGKPAAGGTACQRYCDLSALCRVSRRSIAKTRQHYAE